ncbi:response regulator [Clostridium sp.]|uniref:response regulator n=1 Tax=Clostridium sp. TaxID=1506 RepID=UPI00262E780C|nr:response regulator [Clostridium sp.]
MFRAFVVDNQPAIANLIGKFLEDTGKVKVEKIFYNPLEVINEVQILNPDVIFMDMEMPEITGIRLAEQIKLFKKDIEIVFITAYSNYALQAFKVDALDYVMKPIYPHEIERVVKKIILRNPNFIHKKTFHINALGSFTVYIKSKNEAIKWSTSKCEELLAYMIFSKDSLSVSKWKLIDTLWPGKNIQKSEINLRSTISRLNKTLREYGSDCRITANNNYYRIEFEKLEVDAFVFEKIAEEAMKNKVNINLTLQEFYKLYPGQLFADKDYYWAERLQAYYSRLFINFAKTLVQRRIIEGKEMAITYQMLEYAIEFDPYNEELRELAIEILHKTEGKKAVFEYYQEFERQLMLQIGVKPRQSIQELYMKLVKKKEK